MPKSHRISAPPDGSVRMSFLPRDAAPSAGPARVMVALMSDPLSEKLAAYLKQTNEFTLVGSRPGRPGAPDVVIVDYTPGAGITGVHGETGARPVALAHVCDDDALLGALRGGAWALLPGRPSPFEVTAAVRQVAAGECPILGQIARRPTLAATALGRLRAAAVHPNPLSAREAAILAEVARGAKNGVIGAIFGLREQTVKNYLSGILKKTGAGNRAEAAALAVRHGWLGAE